MGYMNWLFLPGQPGAMKASDWALVHAETLRQCDALDGRVDKIIAHPQHCRFRPEALLCRGNATEGCLNAGQVAALPTLYRDFRDTHGGLASTGLAPGSEIAGTGFDLTFGPTVPFFVLESVRYLVYSDPNWQGGLNFSMADVDAILEKMKDLDTWTGDLRAFKGRGGKMIHIHGNEDSVRTNILHAVVSPRSFLPFLQNSFSLQAALRFNTP
jgi:feruloyl esterase